jgi:hypothetical protein
MEITYSWDCTTVDVRPTRDSNENVVYNVHWKLIGINENGSGTRVIGTQELDISNIENFIPFENLTNEQITSWVESAMGEDQINIYKTALQSQIQELETPTSITMTIGG